MSSNDHLYREIASLREQLSEAEATIKSLRAQISDHLKYPAEFNLTPQEIAVLDCLVQARGICSNEKLSIALGRDREWPTKIVEVYIFWLRKKLEDIPVTIKNDRGGGYLIDQPNRARLFDAMTKRRRLATRKEIEERARSIRRCAVKLFDAWAVV